MKVSLITGASGGIGEAFAIHLAKAKELLSATDLSISEVAFELGFEHPTSFSKLFRAKASQTPGKFRASFN